MAEVHLHAPQSTPSSELEVNDFLRCLPSLRGTLTARRVSVHLIGGGPAAIVEVDEDRTMAVITNAARGPDWFVVTDGSNIGVEADRVRPEQRFDIDIASAVPVESLPDAARITAAWKADVAYTPPAHARSDWSATTSDGLDVGRLVAQALVVFGATWVVANWRSRSTRR